MTSPTSCPACSTAAGNRSIAGSSVMIRCNISGATAVRSRRHRSHKRVPRVAAAASPHLLYQVADEAVAPGLEQALGEGATSSKTSLLKALLERAEAEARLRAAGGGDGVLGLDPQQQAADDAILSRLPGNDVLTSGVAELLRGSEGAASGLQGLLQGSDSLQGAVEGVASALWAAPAAVQQSLESLLQSGSLEPQLQGLRSQLQSVLQGASPEEPLGRVQAAVVGVRAQLDGAVQVVGAAVQPGASPSSSALLESRRAAGHLLDLTPVYKAWANLIQPLEIFGDRWLLNILFFLVFALLGFTMLAKAPRQ